MPKPITCYFKSFQIVAVRKDQNSGVAAEFAARGQWRKVFACPVPRDYLVAVNLLDTSARPGGIQPRQCWSVVLFDPTQTQGRRASAWIRELLAAGKGRPLTEDAQEPHYAKAPRGFAVPIIIRDAR